jgi:hypothetical protein
MEIELNMGMKVVLQWTLKTEFGSAHDQMKNSYMNTVTNIQVLQYQKRLRDLKSNTILRK